MARKEVFSGKLPGTRENTNNIKKYIKAWREFAKPLADALGAKVHSFDPGLTYTFNNRTVSFDQDVVAKLNVALRSKSELTAACERMVVGLESLTGPDWEMNDDIEEMSEQARRAIGK